MSEAAKKMIVLMTSDNQTFEVEESVAVLSQTIKHMIEDNCATSAIPLPNVTSVTLAKVIEYCKKHALVDAAKDDESVKNFDNDFVDVDQWILYDLILAADYLNIKSLLDLICEKVADMIKGKTAEEIRKTFNIKNDFSPEEEAALRMENAWTTE